MRMEWDLERGLPVVLDDGTKKCLYGLDLIASIDGAGVETYYTYDGLGSTADLTDDTATVTDTYSYDVFGDASHDSGSSANPWLFTGEQHDGGSDLYYLRARYYDPATGRFLSQDPLGIGNGYSYVMNNPVRFVDPSGLCHQELGYDRICNMVHHIPPKEGGFVPPYTNFDFDSADWVCINSNCVESPTPYFWLCGGQDCTKISGLRPAGWDCGRDIKFGYDTVCGSRNGHNWFDDLVIDHLGPLADPTAAFVECEVLAHSVGAHITLALLIGSAGWSEVGLALACGGYATVAPPGYQLSP